MTTFDILVFLGGLVSIFLLSVFFIFIAPQIEKNIKKHWDYLVLYICSELHF